MFWNLSYKSWFLNSSNFKNMTIRVCRKKTFFNCLNHLIGQYLKVVQMRFYPFMSNICSNLKFLSCFLTKILSMGNWFKNFLNFDWSKCKPWWQWNWMGKSILEILFLSCYAVMLEKISLFGWVLSLAPVFDIPRKFAW